MGTAQKPGASNQDAALTGSAVADPAAGALVAEVAGRSTSQWQISGNSVRSGRPCAHRPLTRFSAPQETQLKTDPWSNAKTVPDKNAETAQPRLRT